MACTMSQAAREHATVEKRAAASEKAAAAWELIHSRHFSLRQAAWELGCGTYDVGVLLTSHRKILAAESLARAAKAGLGDDTTAAEIASARQLKVDRARKLLADGLAPGVVVERLGLGGSEVARLAEGLEPKADEDHVVSRVAVKPSPKLRRRFVAPPSASVLDMLAQHVRDGWRA